MVSSQSFLSLRIGLATSCFQCYCVWVVVEQAISETVPSRILQDLEHQLKVTEFADPSTYCQTQNGFTSPTSEILCGWQDAVFFISGAEGHT